MGCQHDFPFLGSTRWLQPIVKPKNRSTIQIISMLSDKKRLLDWIEERSVDFCSNKYWYFYTDTLTRKVFCGVFSWVETSGKKSTIQLLKSNSQYKMYFFFKWNGKVTMMLVHLHFDIQLIMLNVIFIFHFSTSYWNAELLISFNLYS